MWRPKHEGLVQRVRLVIRISEVPNWSKSVSLWMEFPMCLFPEGSLWQPTEIPAHSTLAVVNASGIEFSPVWSMWNMGPNVHFWTPVLDLISYYLSLERRVRGTAISSSQLCNIWLTSKHSTSRGQTPKLWEKRPVYVAFSITQKSHKYFVGWFRTFFMILLK